MLPQIGKLDRESFDKIIFPHLGRKDPSVIIGPRHGVDAGVVDLGDGKVMVLKIDPTFSMPALQQHLGWAIVHICASDVACLGVVPRYMTICLLLPPGTSEDLLETIWTQVSDECEKLGIAIVGGHTGIFPGITMPLNGGCCVIGLGTREQLTPASNARVGDKLIVTKGAAIEAGGILAMEGEKDLVRALGRDIVEAGKKRFWDMSVVQDCRVAGPNAHAMHDATEGGLINGVYEVAAASEIGVTLYEDRIFVPEECRAICNHFKIDPLISISEGTLVIAAAPEKAPGIIADLGQNGIQAWDMGEFTAKDRIFIRKNGAAEELKPVQADPFWNAFFQVLGA
ncbi:MAG: AIR synthase family protein [Candidatus Aminicenantales bacterium]